MDTRLPHLRELMLLFCLASGWGLGHCLAADPQAAPPAKRLPPATQPATTQPAATQPAATQPDEPVVGRRFLRMPHLVADRRHRRVEFEAVVIDPTRTDWLELLACYQRMRAHEAVLSVPARPSHIHAALLFLGLDPGHPMSAELNENEQFDVTPAAGPRVAITALVPTPDGGKREEVNVARWIKNRQTGQTLSDNHWMFTGSYFAEVDDREIYAADVNGTIASIVQFGDDLLARRTDVTNRNDDAAWVPNLDALPPAGTRVTLRLTILDPPENDEATPRDQELNTDP